MERGFLLHLGEALRRPGVLTVGWHQDADVPYHPGEDFPFEDGTVEAMTVDDVVERLPLATRVHLLLECRRVLRAGGLLRLYADPPRGTNIGDSAARQQDLSTVAALVGLEHARAVLPPASAPGHLAIGSCPGTLDLTKPERRLTGDPLVSIAIPAYTPGFFALAFESALAQTYDRIEIVVCDDSPGAEIEAMVRAHRDTRFVVRYDRNASRLGPRKNFVRCFERAGGEFVKFLCDDDLLAPACVERLVDAFRQAPDVTLATSHRQRVDEHGARLPDQPATVPIVRESALIAGHTLANAMLMAGLNTIGEPSTALFRKADFLDQAPDYFRFCNTKGHGVIDMVMWSVLLLKGNAVYLRESLSSFRVHAGQRQHHPATRERSIASIRALQAAWLTLGLHELTPDRVLAKPFPPGESDWHVKRVTGFAATRV